MFALTVLGPVVMRADGQALPLRTRKALGLLLLLALEGLQPRSRLSAWLWPELQERDARRNLRRELARLGQAGGAGALRVDGDRLSLAPGVDCDLVHVEAALDARQPEQALARWTGNLAEGLQVEGAPAFDDWLAAQRTRLATLRQRAQQQAAAAAEARGDLEAALTLVLALLADDPLQEAQHRQAMRLQALCGRREAAIAQYERCHALLSAELGLAPMAETDQLLAGLRTPGQAVAAPCPAAALSGAWPPALPRVGRDAEWALMQVAFEAGRPLLIEAEAGVGKTRLATDFAAAQGAYAMAQCRSGDRDVPYASFTRALRCLAGDTLAQAGLPAWVQQELARILPELGVAPPPIGSVEERRHFFEACATAWRELADGNFDSLLVDDYQLADDPSRALFGFVVQQRRDAARRGPVELFAYRPELDAAARHALGALVDDAQGLVLRLQVLGPATVFELVRQLSGAADPQRFAARLEQASGGNPFFMAETLRHWQALQLLSVGADGVWQTPFDQSTPDYDELPMPDSVRVAVLARVRRLPDPARRLLEAAALAAEPFTPALLAGACALSEVEALEAIDAAVLAQLLRERESPAGHAAGYAFVHDLVQQAMDSTLSEARRRLVHRRLALGAEAAALPSTERARHWEAGGEPQRAVVHRIEAGDAAAALYADRDADQHWLAALADQPTLAQRVQIQRRRWGHQRDRDDKPGLEQSLAELDRLHAEVLSLPPSPANTELAQIAAIEAAEILSLTGGSAAALERIEACLPGLAPDSAQRAQALQVLTQALNGVGRTDEALQAAQLALALPKLSPARQAQLLHAQVYSYFLQGQPAPALECTRRCLLLWRSLGRRRSVARALANIGLLLGMLDQQQAAITALQEAHSAAAELGMVDQQREVANNLAYAHLALGQAQQALDVLQQAWDLSPHFTQQFRPIFFQSMRVQAHAQRGDLGAALDCAEDSLARATALGDAHALADCVSMALDVYTFIGDRDGADRWVASLQGLPLEGLDQISIKLAFNLALRSLRQGDTAAAHERLAKLGDGQALAQPQDVASARLCHAQLALAEGRPQAALDWLAPLRDGPLQIELWGFSRAALLAAHTDLGRVDAADLARADAALAHAHLPAMAALVLRHERLRAARLMGDAPDARRLHEQAADLVRALAASLHNHPRQQALFLRRWG